MDRIGWWWCSPHSCQTVLVLRTVADDWPSCSCRSCSRRFRRLRLSGRCPASNAHNVRRCRILSRKSYRRTADRTQYWRAYEFFRIALAGSWFVDYRWVRPMAMDLRRLRCVRELVGHRRWASPLTVVHTRLCAPVVRLTNRSEVRHNGHSVM